MVDEIRRILEDNPELFRQYERSEARYILQLPEEYITERINFALSEEKLKTFISALAELNLSLDEWFSFKLKELIIADKLSKNDHCLKTRNMMNYLEIEKLRCVTREEVQKNTEAILGMTQDGNGPILIRSEGLPDLLLIAWEEYWELFGMLYGPGERKAIEDACRSHKEET